MNRTTILVILLLMVTLPVLAEKADVAQFGNSPDTTTRWGARARIRAGALRGVLFSVDRTETDFLDPGTNRGVLDNKIVDWGRHSGRSKHRVRLENTGNGTGGLGVAATRGLTNGCPRLWTLSVSAWWAAAGIGSLEPEAGV